MSERFVDAPVVGQVSGWEQDKELALSELTLDAGLDRGYADAFHLPDAVAGGISDEQVAIIAPATGSVAVVEWISTGDLIGSFVTIVDSNKKVESSWLEFPEVDLGELVESLRWKLSVWTHGRIGDPFDSPNWIKVQEWLRSKATKTNS